MAELTREQREAVVRVLRGHAEVLRMLHTRGSYRLAAVYTDNLATTFEDPPPDDGEGL